MKSQSCRSCFSTDLPRGPVRMALADTALVICSLLRWRVWPAISKRPFRQHQKSSASAVQSCPRRLSPCRLLVIWWMGVNSPGKPALPAVRSQSSRSVCALKRQGPSYGLSKPFAPQKSSFLALDHSIQVLFRICSFLSLRGRLLHPMLRDVMSVTS